MTALCYIFLSSLRGCKSEALLKNHKGSAQSIMDISQINIKELIRDVKKEKTTLKQMLENNMMLLNLQKQILKLQIAEDQERKKKQERENKRRKDEER